MKKIDRWFRLWAVARSKIVVICGPTASGKSALGLEVARHLGGEIINADSMQVYRYMDIGTAKPSVEERAAVRHHLIDILYPDEVFSAALYCEAAHETIADVVKRGKIPLVVGGTGLYIKALTSGLIRGGEVDEALRSRLNKEAEAMGREYLYQRLQKVDPKTAASLHPNDTYRIVRALEVYERTGRPISLLRERHRFQEAPYEALKIGLMPDRATLYRRIDERVDQMVAVGLKEEVQRLLDMGYAPHLRSMQGLGYRQMVPHLKGSYDLAEATKRIKRDTKRYAKRQLTWFKRDPEIHWVSYPLQGDAIIKMIAAFWNN